MPVQNNFEDTSATNEVAPVARALKAATRCDKLNLAAIGNVVPQLHIHIAARTSDDALWPKPAWGAAPPRAYDPATLERFVTAIRERVRGAGMIRKSLM